MDAVSQTSYRDGETQTSCFDLTATEQRLIVQPGPSIVEGFHGEADFDDWHSKVEEKEGRFLFARAKEIQSLRSASVVSSSRSNEIGNIISKHNDFLEQN
eukprot:c16635_g2_i1 orf=108-407(+)